MNVKPRYFLPNTFTVGSIFLGVFSVIYSCEGNFKYACLFILFSVILDGLDGRVARLTNATSKFGVEFDSLADVVAFGVAPAILLFFYVGIDYGRIGYVVSAVFVTFGALRLARFNVANAEDEPNNFIGLPIPAAALTLSFLILNDMQYNMFVKCPHVLLLMSFILAILMVSNVRYPNFKKNKWMFRHFVLGVIVIAAILIQPAEILLGLMSVYILYGIIRWCIIFVRVLCFRKK